MANANKREIQIEFVRWYRRTSQNEKVLRVFIKKDYYTVYGKENSEYIAQHFYRTKESIRSFGSEDSTARDKIECIYFREQMFKRIVRDYVLRQQKTVEIYQRDAESGNWLIKNKITSSNLSVGSVAEAAFNLISVVISISKQRIKTLGIALCNLSNHSFEIAEFIEDAQYTKLSSLFVAKGVKQCIFKMKSSNKSNVEMDKFTQILQNNGVQLIDICDNKFWSFMNARNERSTISSINNMLNKASSKRLLSFTNYPIALNALYGIILHQDLQKDNKNFNRYKLTQNKIDSFMRLDSSALNALSLFPTMEHALSNKNDNNSLYGVLKKCKSAMGDRLLSVWIRQPLVDVHEIHRRQKLIKLFVENNECREIIRDDYLKSLVDLENLANKLMNNRATLKDLVELYNFAEKIPWIKDTLNGTIDVPFNEYDDDEEDDDIKINDNKPLDILKKQFIAPMIEMEHNFNNYLAMIESIVDLAATSRREYLIKSEFDNLLDKFDKKRKKIKAEMDKMEQESINKLGESGKKKSIRLDRHKSYGYCLRIIKSKAKKLKKSSDYQILSTQKNCVFFTDSASSLRKLSKSYIDYEKRYRDRQKIIVDKTIEITTTYISVIDQATQIFSELDVIMSLAHVATYTPSHYVLPKVFPSSSNKMIKIANARHPCLELIQLDDIGGVIPNDVELLSDKSSFQIVTGPNMGGKSTYIRMIGLIVLMAQIGSYVPADSCSLTVIDSILARVGAGDNQLRGVSTFMSEMLESASILEAATPNSLIIVDELGRGTSTYDGYGIAYAISEHIIRKLKSFCLFATHFHELSALSAQYQCAVNKHVTAHFDEGEDTLTMLYKIKRGPCPQSFGIQVAKLAKFPKYVIDIAKNKADELESAGSNNISSLTYNTIQSILRKYKEIEEKDWSEQQKEYLEKIESFKTFIKTEMIENQELKQIASKLKSNNNDTMDID